MKTISALLLTFLLSVTAGAQAKPPKEKAAEAFSFPTVDTLPVQPGLPDPFIRENGNRVENREHWPACASGTPATA